MEVQAYWSNCIHLAYGKGWMVVQKGLEAI